MTTFTIDDIGADTLDSRDIINRIDELRDERDGLQADLDACVANPADPEYRACRLNLENWQSEYADELDRLERFAVQLEDCCPDWTYGQMLIENSYFETYVQEFAEETGAVDPAAPWPLNHIDWKGAARELQTDYTYAEIDGFKYWARS